MSPDGTVIGDVLMTETLQLRIHNGTAHPTLIYLPGLHGDWTLLGAFRDALAGRARLVETSYPRRADWTLADFATGVEAALAQQGITEGWLLGESFSSQIAWALLERFLDRIAPSANESRPSAPAPAFRPLGLILVGGFVRHPWPWGVHLARGVSGLVPMWVLKRACAFYGRAAGRRLGGRAERCVELQEFVTRRTQPHDRAAVTSRYGVITRGDLRPVARRMSLPVYQLSGAIDPIVPWWLVRNWLLRHCPGYRESRIIRRAGHNVLLDAAAESADQILHWTCGTRWRLWS